MELLVPELGLFFWTTLIFLAVFLVLRRFAWKPILEAIHEREHQIESSLKEAQAARDEMARLRSDNEAMMKEARVQADKILKDAQLMRDQIVKEAQTAASDAATKEKEKARVQIEAEKNAALSEIRQSAAGIAVEVAEIILRKHFEDKQSQEGFARQLINDLSKN